MEAEEGEQMLKPAALALSAAMAFVPARLHAQAFPADMGANGSQFQRYADPSLSGPAAASPLSDTDRILSQNPYMTNDNATGGYGTGRRASQGEAARASGARKKARAAHPAAAPAPAPRAAGNGGSANRTLPSTSQSSLPIVLAGLSLSGAGLALRRLCKSRNRIS